MQGSKLLETLSFFSREEMVQLGKFLESPYFFDKNTPAEILPLFQYINSFYTNPEHPQLVKEQVFKHLFPRSKYIDGKMDKLMSGLLKQINRFIGIHFNERSYEIQEKLTLINFFHRRNSDKFAAHYLHKLKKDYQKTSIKDAAFYADGFDLAQEEFKWRKSYAKFEYLENISDTFHSLDVYYLLTKLEHACYLLSVHRFQKPIDTKATVAFLDHAKPLYEAKGILKIPLINVYFHAYELLKNEQDDPSIFEELKRLIEHHERHIPFDTVLLLSGIIRNFIIRRYNYGAINAMQEVFELYKDHLEKGYLYTGTGILPHIYKNMVTTGLRIKDFDWVWQFMHDYKDKLEGTQHPEEVYHYNLAHYYFEKKDYDKSIDLLANRYEDLYYKIAAKRLELKVYYESGSNILPSKIDAFKLYIFRLPKEAILDHKKNSNNSFINILRQVSNKKAISSSSKVEKLITKVENTQLITEKEWLLDKLRGLL